MDLDIMALMEVITFMYRSTLGNSNLNQEKQQLQMSFGYISIRK